MQLTTGPWVMAQTWHDLLFAHWPVDPAALGALMPFEPETFEGQAWVAVVPFRMSGIRLRGMPALPLTRAFLELNVRTYVTFDGKPGVYFFSLDANNFLAVEAARRTFHLNYLNADMMLFHEAECLRYVSRRIDPRGEAATFAGTYGPTGDVYRSEPGTLENWLTERYYLYSIDPAGQVYRGEIFHEPWPLQPAEADLRINDVAQSHGITLPAEPPLLHFARRLGVIAGAVQRIAP